MYNQRFDDGQAGKYQGLDNGLGRINKYIYNVQRKWYYLFGGLSNSGKTTLVDSMLLNAIRDAKEKGIELNIFYYSYEIDAETKFAQWMSNHIHRKYNITIAPEAIAGLGDNRLEQYQAELVKMEIEEVESIFNSIHFRFDPTNPTGIYKELFDFYSKTGTWEEESYRTIEKDKYDNDIELEKRRIVSYTSDNAERYVIVVMDHIALCKLERQYSLKQNIDKMSEYCVWLRNICGTTFFILQQFNQGMHSIERKKYNGEELVPQQNDFKDSGNPYQDCDTAVGIMNPHAMKTEAGKIFGYDIKEKIKNNFRILNIMKNRKGRAQLVFAYYFNPKTASFKNLPKADELSDNDIRMINEGTYT
jgi:replicative DNA helicase